MGFFQHKKALVHEGAKVGDDTRIWANTNIQEGAIIGSGCNICDGSFVEKGAIVGNNVTIKHYVSIFDGVTIEDDVFIGSNIAFINDRHPRAHREGFTLERTKVSKGASIGTNSVILCGVTIGEHAFVGAGSVVTRDVAPYGLVCGNPAKLVGYACRCGFKLKDDLSCSCGKKYSKAEEGLQINE